MERGRGWWVESGLDGGGRVACRLRGRFCRSDICIEIGKQQDGQGRDLGPKHDGSDIAKVWHLCAYRESTTSAYTVADVLGGRNGVSSEIAYFLCVLPAVQLGHFSPLREHSCRSCTNLILPAFSNFPFLCHTSPGCLICLSSDLTPCCKSPALVALQCRIHRPTA